MSDQILPDYALLNRALWTRANAAYTDGSAREAWSQADISWGVWHAPEAELRVLPRLWGMDVVELGCGTAYFGAWLKRAGAHRVVGVDVTPAQLATARRLDAEFGLGLELIEGNAEAVPLADAQFDLAVSEYGASLWCDPARWIPEAARLLRPRGELVFMRPSTVSMLCAPATGPTQERLVRPQAEIYRIDWPPEGEDPGATEFHAPPGELIRILRRSGFEILDLVELLAPPDAEEHPYYDNVPVGWAQRWPAEEIWKARKRLPDPSEGNE
jgi:ubiquinone/menaquinone biosynthesis C-methylase UbiE